LLLFSAGFICSVGVSAFVLWQTDVLSLPNQAEQPVVSTVVQAETLYPAQNEDGLWGYINEQGVMVLPAVYEDAKIFGGKAAWVKSGGLWGAIDAEGNFIVKPEYADISLCEYNGNAFVAAYGSVAASQSPNSSFYDANGLKLFGLAGDLGEMSEQSDGLMAFSRYKNGQASWGYINPHGEIVIDPIYAEVGRAAGNYALVRDFDGKTLLLNIYAKTGVPIDGVESLDAVGSRLVLVQSDGKYGYMSVDGELVIDFSLASAEPFRGGAALASELQVAENAEDSENNSENEGNAENVANAANNKEGFGLLTPDGAWAAAPVYASGEYLENGLYALKLAGEPGYALVNSAGDRVVEDTVYGFGEWLDGVLSFWTDSYTGFVSSDGVLLAGLELNVQPGVFRTGNLFGVRDDNGLTWFDEQGQTIYSAGRDRALTEGVQLLTVLENDSADYLVYYPQVETAEGVEGSATWRRLNNLLEESALGDYYDSYRENDELKFTVSGDFSLVQTGGVLTVVQRLSLDDSWRDENGGVEEVIKTVCFNKESGRQYRLADLFLDSANWRTELLEPARGAYSMQCAGQGVPENAEVLEFLDKRLSRSIPFSLGADSLTIYITLSDGSTQALNVYYQDIEGLIDRDGTLWQSLQVSDSTGITAE
jgi:hypothetical protein